MYTEMYLHMKDLGFKVKVIAYEDLVLRTEGVMEEISDFLDKDHKDKVKVVTTKAKNHGGSVGRTEAINKIKSKSWLKGVAKADLTAICERLDVDILRQFKYDDCFDHTGSAVGRKLGHVVEDSKPGVGGPKAPSAYKDGKFRTNARGGQRGGPKHEVRMPIGKWITTRPLVGPAAPKSS